MTRTVAHPTADLPVEGEVPDWLFGSLVLLGPGKFDVAGKKLAHHFCGFGMLHRFGFHEGRVSYRNRFVKSKGLRYVGTHSRLGYNTYATAVTPERFQEILAESATGAEPNVDANVSIARIADDFVALTDGSTLPVRYAGVHALLPHHAAIRGATRVAVPGRGIGVGPRRSDRPGANLACQCGAATTYC
jgi:carotenoid cleavage dioxygenase-like enzyme